MTGWLGSSVVECQRKTLGLSLARATICEFPPRDQTDPLRKFPKLWGKSSHVMILGISILKWEKLHVHSYICILELPFICAHNMLKTLGY